MTTTNLLQQGMTRYLQHLEGDRRSLLTVESYRQSLELFTELTGLTDPDDIKKETIREYKSDLAVLRTQTGGQLSVATRNKHLTILRGFLRYLVKEEEMVVYSPDRITRLKEDERQVKFLNDEKVERLLAQPHCTSKIGRRDRAILELFYSTGLRLSELCSLNRGHIDLKSKEISIKGKRGKVRVVFVSDEAGEAITQYLSIRLDHLEPLFIGRHDKARMAMPPGNEFRLSHRSVQRLVGKYARLAGLVDNPSPHTMRHSFATDLLRNGADLRSIQSLLGHKDLSTTQIYTHVTDPMLKEVHQRYHRGQAAKSA